MFDIQIHDRWLSSYGICIEKRPDIPAPVPKYRDIDIPGRDGSFIEWDGTYHDIVIEIKCNYIAKDSEYTTIGENWYSIWYEIKNSLLVNRCMSDNWLMKFSDDNITDSWCYKIKKIELGTNERRIIQSGEFTIKVTCDPYVYNEQGQCFTDFSNTRDFTNNYVTTSPTFKIQAEGYGSLTVNNNKLEFNATGTIIIDISLKIAYRNDNGTLVLVPTKGNFDNLVFKHGKNTLNFYTPNVAVGSLQCKVNTRRL